MSICVWFHVLFFVCLFFTFILSFWLWHTPERKAASTNFIRTVPCLQFKKKKEGKKIRWHKSSRLDGLGGCEWISFFCVWCKALDACWRINTAQVFWEGALPCGCQTLMKGAKPPPPCVWVCACVRECVSPIDAKYASTDIWACGGRFYSRGMFLLSVLFIMGIKGFCFGSRSLVQCTCRSAHLFLFFFKKSLGTADGGPPSGRGQECF